MRAFIASLVAIAVSGKPTGGYDYTKGGDNWTGTCTNAASKKQSPINLPTSGDDLIKSDQLRVEVDGLGSYAKNALATAN